MLQDLENENKNERKTTDTDSHLNGECYQKCAQNNFTVNRKISQVS